MSLPFPLLICWAQPQAQRWDRETDSSRRSPLVLAQRPGKRSSNIKKNGEVHFLFSSLTCPRPQVISGGWRVGWRVGRNKGLHEPKTMKEEFPLWAVFPRMWTECPYFFSVLLPLDPRRGCSCTTEGKIKSQLSRWRIKNGSHRKLNVLRVCGEEGAQEMDFLMVFMNSLPHPKLWMCGSKQHIRDFGK